MEDRSLLSGDALTFDNAFWPANVDHNLALAPQAALSAAQVVSGGEGESQTTDVVRYSLTLTDTSNVALPDRNKDGIPEVTQGQTFRLHGSVQDVRAILGGISTGVFAAYMDVMAVDAGRLALRYGETQQLLFVPTTHPDPWYPTQQVADMVTGTFTLTFQAQTTQAISAQDSIDPDTGDMLKSRAQLIQEALAALPAIGTGNVEVTKSLTNENAFNIRFINDLGERDLPGMTGNFSALTHLASAPSIADNFYPADISNPGTLGSSIAHVSPYINGPAPSASSAVPAPGGSLLAEVGSFLDAFSVAQPGGRKEFFTVDIRAQQSGEIDFWGVLPSTSPGHETIVFPSGTGGGTVAPAFLGFVQDAASPLRLMITAPGVPPVAQNDSFGTDEDTQLVVNAPGLLANDSDPEGHALQVTAVGTSGLVGKLSWQADGSFTYDPRGEFDFLPAGQHVAGTAMYTVSDGQGGTAQAILTVTIAGVNDAPVAHGPPVNTDVNQPVAVTLTADDVESEPLTFTLVTPPLHGTLSGIGPALTYTPATDYNGGDSFTYQANDGQANSNVAMVTIRVGANLPVGQNPVNRFDVNADGAVEPLDYVVLINYVNSVSPVSPDSPTLYWDVNGDGVSSPTDILSVIDHLTAQGCSPPVSVSERQDVVPAADVVAAFRLEVWDLAGRPVTQAYVGDTVQLRIYADDNRPDFQGVAAGFLDVRYDPALVSVAGAVQHGGTYTVVPSGDSSLPGLIEEVGGGAAQFSLPRQSLLATVPFIVVGSGVVQFQAGAADVIPCHDVLVFGSNTAVSLDQIRYGTASLAVSARSNHAPTAIDASVSTPAGQSVAVPLTAADADSDPLTFTVLTQPAHGTLSGTVPNLAYTPEAGFAGGDSFTFKANDGLNDSNAATVAIVVVDPSTDVVRYSLTVTDTSNVPLPDYDLDGIPDVAQGQTFRLHGTVQDVRNILGDTSTGVFAAYMNLNADNRSLISLRYGETQQLLFVPTTHADSSTPPQQEDDAVTGTFTLSFQGQTTQPINAQDSIDADTGDVLRSRAQLIQDALAALPNIGAGNVQVTQTLTNRNAFNIRFTNQWGEQDVPPMTLADTSQLTSLQSVGVTDNFFPADVSNPGTLASSFAHVSPYVNGPSPTADMTLPAPGGTLLAEVGSFVNGFSVAQPGAEKELFTVDIQAQLPGEVDFWGALPATLVGHETLVFPSSGGGTKYVVDPQFIAFAQNAVIPLRLMISTPAVVTPPVAQDDDFSTSEDTPLVVSAPGVLANDSDPAGHPLHVTGVDTQGMLGQLKWSADGSFAYDPRGALDFLSAGQRVAGTAVYAISDGQGGTAQATITVTINGVNDAPVADTPSVSAGVNQSVAVNLTAHDVESDPLSFTVLTQPDHGTLSGTAPNLTYTPSAGYTGGDSFTFKANDGLIDSNVATVVIDVVDPSTNVVRYSLTVTDTSNGPLPDYDLDGIPDVTQGQTFRLHGTVQDVRSLLGGTSTGVFAAYVSLEADNRSLISLRFGETQQLLFVPTTHADTSTPPVQVNDTITGTFTLTYNGQTTAAINAQDTRINGVTVKRAQLIQNALAALSNIGTGNVQVTASLTNSNAFNIRFINNLGEQDIAGMTGNFSSLLHLASTPVIQDNFYPADLSSQGTFASSFAHVSPYINGPFPSADSAIPAADSKILAEVGSFLNGFSIDPADSSYEFFTVDIKANSTGEVDFFETVPSTAIRHDTLVFSDAGGGTKFVVDPQFVGFAQDALSPLRLMISTPVVVTPPVAQNDSFSTDEDSPLVVNAAGLLANDSDPDGHSLQVTAIDTSGLVGRLSWQPDGSFTYDPRGAVEFLSAGQHVAGTAVYTISDGHGGTAQATITVTIAGVNDAPVATDDRYTIDEDSVLTVSAPGVLAHDTDVDAGTTLHVTAVDTRGLMDALSWQSDGSFTYDPRGALDFLPAGQTAAAQAVYTISDGNGGTAQATVTVTIAGVNDPPVAHDESLVINYYTSQDLLLIASDIDDSLASLTYTVVTPPAHGSLSGITSQRTYLPAANYRGVDSFTFQANDGHANSQLATVTLIVAGVGPDGFEPNETEATAADLGVVQGVRQEDALTLHVPGDEDWFQFQTVATGNALSQVSVAFTQGLGTLNLELDRWEQGQRVAVGSSAMSANGKQISLAGQPAGTYLVHVSGAAGATCPDYTLQIDAPYGTVILPDAFEPNDTWQTASNLQVVDGQHRWAGLTVHTSGNQDWYRFETGTASDSQSAVAIEFQQLLGDLDVSVYRVTAAAPDVLLAVGHSAGAGDGELVSLAGQPAGVFFVCVRGYGDDTSPDYTLHISAPLTAIPADRFEPNDSSDTAADLGAIEGPRRESALTVHQPRNADWYRFSTLAVGARESSVAVMFDPLLGPLSLNVYRQEAGQLVAVGSAAAAGNEELVSLFGQPAGTYLVQVVGFDNATSPNYALQVLTPFAAGIPADRYEPNDTRATATDLSVVIGQLRLDGLTVQASDNADWFRFQTLEAGIDGDRVTLNMLGTGDLDLQLFAASGDYLAGSFSSGDTEQVSLAKLPQGTYYIAVTGFNGATNPDYALVIDAPQPTVQIPADIAEPNDARQAAFDLRVVVGQVSPLPPLTIHRPGDEDWFRFQTTGDAGRTHYVRIDFSNSLGDLALELYDASGNQLRVSQGQADYEQMNLGGLPAATYFLRVHGIADAISPMYALSFWAPEPNVGLRPDDYEPNNTQATAYNFRELAQSLTAANLTIHSPTDQDWFAFTTTAAGQVGHNVRIQFQHALGDLDLFLFSAQQTKPLASSQGTGDGEQVSLAGLPAGTYYVQVVGYGGALSPNYTLTIEPPVRVPLLPDRFEPNATSQTATVLHSDAGGLSLTGSLTLQDLTIHDPSDSDYYSFTTVGTGLLGNGVSLLSQSADGALGMELLDAHLAVLSQVEGAVDVMHLSLAGLPAGTYYLRVFGLPGAINRYGLSLDVPRSADPAQNVGDWTVLVYMTASDLTQAAFDDVNELEAAAAQLSGSVKLALLWDQSSMLSTYPTGGGTQNAWGTTGRALVVGDTDPTRIATTFEILPEQDTGDPATLQSFLQWAKAVAPARNYALIMWDHGSGLGGFNFDNADLPQAPDNLTTSEFAGVLQQSNPRIQLVAFDACLMGTAEMGYSLRNLTDVLVASEEVVAAAGFDYSTVFEPLYVHPESVGAEELGTGLVRSFEQQYGNTSSTSDTLSAMRAGGYQALATALNAFVTATAAATSDDLARLRVDRNSATQYAYSYLRDLGSFLVRVQDDPLLSAGIRQAATGVLGALAGVVVAQTADQRNSSGASIFLPRDGRDVSGYAGQYAAFDTATQWSQFLNRLGISGPPESGIGVGRSLLTEDWAEPNEVPVEAFDLHDLRGAGNLFQGLNLQSVADTDWFRFTLDATAGAADRVFITPSAGAAALTLALCDPLDSSVLRTVTGTGGQSLTLSGLAAGVYLLHVGANAEVSSYTLTVDAPVADAVADWAGNNATASKAYPLGLIDNQALFSGLGLAAAAEDWFTFATPRLVESLQFGLTISVGQGGVFSAELRKGNNVLVGTATGSGSLFLPFAPSRAGENYTLHVTNTPNPGDASGESAGNASYNLLFQTLYNYWHNAVTPVDVSNDGQITPSDALYVITYINSHPVGALPAPDVGSRQPTYDVNNDGSCTPTDVLTVINYLNSSRTVAEGEAASATTAPLPVEQVQAIPVLVAAAVEASPPSLVSQDLTTAEPVALASRDAWGTPPSLVAGVVSDPSRETELADRSWLRASDGPGTTCWELAALNLDDVLQDIAPAIAEHWQ